VASLLRLRPKLRLLKKLLRPLKKLLRPLKKPLRLMPLRKVLLKPLRPRLLRLSNSL